MEPLIIGITILCIWAIMGVLIALGKLPVIIGLPAFAFFIALGTLVPIETAAKVAFVDGFNVMAPVIVPLILGATLAEVIIQTGIAENILKRTAELAGGKPFVTALALCGALGMIHSTLWTIGPVIATGVIFIPILMSVGLSKKLAASMFIIGIDLGHFFNWGTWITLTNITKVTLHDVINFAIPFVIVEVTAWIIFLTIHLRKEGISFYSSSTAAGEIVDLTKIEKKVPVYSFLTPIIPLILMLGFNMDVLLSFIIGILYGILTTWRGRSLGTTRDLGIKCMYDGCFGAAPIIWLNFGVGAIAAATRIPEAKAAILPIIGHIAPTSLLTYAAFFIILAPLVLFRGPLNMFGFGAGVYTILMSLGVFSPLALTIWIACASIVSRWGCPTVSQVVWTNGYLNLDPKETLLRNYPYGWVVGSVTLIAGAILYLRF